MSKPAKKIIIDGHVHVGSWKYEHYRFVNNSFAEDISSLKCISPIETVLDENEITGAVLIPTDAGNDGSLLKAVSDYSGGKKYWYFAWCDPKDKKLMSWLEDNADAIDGLKLHSAFSRVPGGVTRDIYKSFFAFARKKNIPVIVHSGRWQEMSSYKFVFEAARRYPDVRFICAHLGGDFEGLKIEAPREYKKARLDNLWFDTSGTREFWTIEMAVEEIGAERIIFGSDYPVMHPRMAIAAIEALKLTDEEKSQIYSKNILKVLGEE